MPSVTIHLSDIEVARLRRMAKARGLMTKRTGKPNAAAIARDLLRAALTNGKESKDDRRQRNRIAYLKKTLSRLDEAEDFDADKAHDVFTELATILEERWSSAADHTKKRRWRAIDDAFAHYRHMITTEDHAEMYCTWWVRLKLTRMKQPMAEAEIRKEGRKLARRLMKNVQQTKSV